MIPLHKLEKLPRSQKLRKIIKIFTEAEQILIRSGSEERERIFLSNYSYLTEILQSLCRDPLFRAPAAAALNAALTVLTDTAEGLRITDSAAGTTSSPDLRRAFNTVRHILLTETGKQTADWDFIDNTGRLDSRGRKTFPGMRIYLEDIRSPFNVGAMFRTAESFGAERLYLSSLCADPEHARARRTAMGCVELVPWERLKREPFTGSPISLVQEGLSMEGPFFALETGGIPLDRFSFPCRGIMIAGSEELGVSPQALATADASLGRVSIPTWGAKGSLNVSVAFGIALQAWAFQLSLKCIIV
jgi:TrmH family RNA methyltransferase